MRFAAGEDIDAPCCEDFDAPCGRTRTSMRRAAGMDFDAQCGRRGRRLECAALPARTSMRRAAVTCCSSTESPTTRQGGRCAVRPAWTSIMDERCGRRGRDCAVRQARSSMRIAAGVDVILNVLRCRCAVPSARTSMLSSAGVDVDAPCGRQGRHPECAALPAWTSMRRAAGVDVDRPCGRLVAAV